MFRKEYRFFSLVVDCKADCFINHLKSGSRPPYKAACRDPGSRGHRGCWDGDQRLRMTRRLLRHKTGRTFQSQEHLVSGQFCFPAYASLVENTALLCHQQPRCRAPHLTSRPHVRTPPGDLIVSNPLIIILRRASTKHARNSFRVIQTTFFVNKHRLWGLSGAGGLALTCGLQDIFS